MAIAGPTTSPVGAGSLLLSVLLHLPRGVVCACCGEECRRGEAGGGGGADFAHARAAASPSEPTVTRRPGRLWGVFPFAPPLSLSKRKSCPCQP